MHKKRNCRHNILQPNTKIFKKKDLNPHRFQGWLNPRIEDEAQFEAIVAELSDLYHRAAELEDASVHVADADEKCGVQAREHKAPKIAMKPGVPIDGAARTAEIPFEASDIQLEASDITFETAVISIETAEIPTAAATPASGIPALAAAAAPTRPSAWPRNGIPERIDPECKRHGASGAVASRNAAAGEILPPPPSSRQGRKPILRGV
jgi:hypothetical protein